MPVRPRDRVDRRPVRRSSSSASRTACPTAWRWPSTRRSGVIVHTGDFKIDQTPLDGEHFDVHRFAELGAQGVLALFADSTNIDRRGFTGSETRGRRGVRGDLHERDRAGSIVAAFASSIYRMQILVDLAAQFDRKVAFVGRGMIENSQIAQRLGYLRIPAGRADSRLRRRRATRRRTCCA